MSYGTWIALPLMALSIGACVPQGKYDAALKDAQTAHADSQRCAGDVAALRAQVDHTPDGRAKNRRTEITLEPNINELVAIPTTP
jgi:hypothetical protein